MGKDILDEATKHALELESDIHLDTFRTAMEELNDLQRKVLELQEEHTRLIDKLHVRYKVENYQTVFGVSFREMDDLEFWLEQMKGLEITIIDVKRLSPR